MHKSLRAAFKRYAASYSAAGHRELSERLASAARRMRLCCETWQIAERGCKREARVTPVPFTCDVPMCPRCSRRAAAAAAAQLAADARSIYLTYGGSQVRPNGRRNRYGLRMITVTLRRRGAPSVLQMVRDGLLIQDCWRRLWNGDYYDAAGRPTNRTHSDRKARGIALWDAAPAPAPPGAEGPLPGYLRPNHQLGYVAKLEYGAAGHAHLHVLFCGPWLDEGWLRDRWRALTSTDAQGAYGPVRAPSDQVSVDALYYFESAAARAAGAKTFVADGSGNGGELRDVEGLERAAKEVAKYLAKATAGTAVDPAADDARKTPIWAAAAVALSAGRLRRTMRAGAFFGAARRLALEQHPPPVRPCPACGEHCGWWLSEPLSKDECERVLTAARPPPGLYRELPVGQWVPVYMDIVNARRAAGPSRKRPVRHHAA